MNEIEQQSEDLTKANTSFHLLKSRVKKVKNQSANKREPLIQTTKNTNAQDFKGMRLNSAKLTEVKSRKIKRKKFKLNHNISLPLDSSNV